MVTYTEGFEGYAVGAPIRDVPDWWTNLNLTVGCPAVITDAPAHGGSRSLALQQRPEIGQSWYQDVFYGGWYDQDYYPLGSFHASLAVDQVAVWFRATGTATLLGQLLLRNDLSDYWEVAGLIFDSDRNIYLSGDSSQLIGTWATDTWYRAVLRPSTGWEPAPGLYQHTITGIVINESGETVAEGQLGYNLADRVAAVLTMNPGVYMDDFQYGPDPPAQIAGQAREVRRRWFA